MPTAVLNLTQKISAFLCPLRQSLPPERSLRSAHRLSESSSYTSDIPYAAESKGEAPLVERESPENRPKGSLVVSFLFFTGRGDSFLSPKRERKEWGRKSIRRGIQGHLPEPNCDPATRSQFGKEEGRSEYAVFGVSRKRNAASFF